MPAGGICDPLGTCSSFKKITDDKKAYKITQHAKS